MQYVLASSNPLPPLGQGAAIVLLLYFLILVLLGLGLTLGLMFGLGWVREKTELIKRLRPTVESVNHTTEAAVQGDQYALVDQQNKVIRTVAEVPARAHNIEQKIEQGSDRVAGAVIEFRARTQMAKAIVKAFFLPGLTHGQPALLFSRKKVSASKAPATVCW